MRLAWLEVNNRAFATHPEQGGWTIEELLEREREPLVRSGRLSCCTRSAVGWPAPAGRRSTVDEDPPLGEIYAISVDPDFPGPRLGPIADHGRAIVADRCGLNRGDALCGR